MKYNITNNNLLQVFKEIEKVIKENEQTIKKIIEIDKKHCEISTNIENLKKVLEALKNQKIAEKIEKTIKIHYNGNPYITLNLSILAIITKTTIILECKENMLGINTFIVKTVNSILNDLNTENMIFINQEENNNIDSIICIDDINQYNSYLLEKRENLKFYSFNYIDFYCDTEELEELSELIFRYGEDNLIPIEVYSELESEQAFQMIESGLGKMTVILTENKETKEKAKKYIKSKKVYINENPFKKEMNIIEKEVLYI